MRTRHLCPACNDRKRTFVRYVDTDTGEPLDPLVGRCNREVNCGYHSTPKQYFNANSNFESYTRMMSKPIKSLNASSMPDTLFKKSLTAYERNHFIKFLIQLFGIDITSSLISQYFLGSSDYWDGATIFWQIDLDGKIRTGKVMLYDFQTGRRVKEPFNHIQWAHKIHALTNFNLKQCFFGEHLLQDAHKPVAIAESEKTALIASVYLPDYIWLATGGLQNLSAERCKVLKGRKVLLFPDAGGHEKWNQKVMEINLPNMVVSNLLDQKASESAVAEGLDIADFLIEAKMQKHPPQKVDYCEHSVSDQNNKARPITTHLTEDEDINKWNEIDMLIKDLQSLKLPTAPLKINSAETIIDVEKFINGHLEICKAQKGKRTYLPYLQRLLQLKEYLN